MVFVETDECSLLGYLLKAINEYKQMGKMKFWNCTEWYFRKMILLVINDGVTNSYTAWAPEVFLACGGNFRCWPKAGTSSALSFLACENIRFSWLFAAGDVSRRGTSTTQRQKFHTDDANQCLHNKSGSHGVPNINLSNFMCLLVDFGKVLCSSANELQQNSNASSREDYIPQILTVLLEILRVYIWPLWPFVFCLSFVNNS